MSEFMEPHSVAKLIGSPPGYIGYREEGQLVRELRSKPYSIVLLDEIEKASPNIFDLFLQLFDEGRLTDTQGHQVDGRHAIYILTSNAGTEFLGRRALGFGMERANQEEIFQRDLRAHLLQIFRQEFLNRIDEVIIFNSLLPEHIRSIALQQIGFLQQRILTEHRIRLEVMPEVCDEVCKAGYSEKLGARPLNRAITQLVAAPLSEMLVNGVNGAIVAKVVDEHIVFENTGSESI
jgi:ATP-dependent Clp protease ATP-binding subunit ClpA